MVDSLTSFSGLATGIDTASIVTELVRVESIPIERLRVQQANHDSIASRLGTIRGRLDSIKSAAETIIEQDTPSTVRSSDESSVRAAVLGEPVPGSYQVEVTSLATAQRVTGNGFAERDTAGSFTAGSSLDITVGTDDAVTIEVFAADTLDSVAQRINDSDARVTASVIFDGTDFRLQVSGNETGAANAVTFTESGTGLGLDDPANVSVAAADAQFTVDGIAMTRSTNAVTEAIPGVRLDLEAATDGVETITVERDSVLSDQVGSVLDAFNSVVSAINVESIFQGEARRGDSLAGDSTLRSLQAELANTIFASIPGFDNLSQIGIESTQTGNLELDLDTFSTAFNADPGAVERALVGTESEDGFLDALIAVVDRYADADTGLLSDRIDNFAAENRRIDDRIATMQVRIDQFETNLQRRFASLETLVSGLNSQGQQLLAILGTV
ncbi:MAG: flagellar filament capping protein FliD [Myxococcota bacterium]